MTSTLQSILRSGAAVLAAASMLALGVPASYADGAVNARNITAQSQTDVAPAADSVASIGDATYPTLADAIAAATEGQTVTLTADSAESVTIKTAITLTAANNAIFTGSMRINADGTAVKGMSFKLDPATNKNAQNVIVSKAADVAITGNTFTIAAGDPATGASANKDWQPSSVWLESGAARTVISDNTFALGQVVNNSAVGVNLVGNGKAPIADTVVERNTVTAGPISGTGSSGSMMFVIGNGNTTKADTEAGTYGITGLRFAGNTVTNGTGLAAKVSRTYPIAVTATKGTVIENNTMEG